MEKPAATGPEDGSFVLSDLPPDQAQKRLAIGFAFGIVVAFFIVVALSDNQPRPIAGFVLAFSTAMFVCDAITAVLLFAQSSILRSRALLVLANGYVFTALILIPYTLTFPGVFGPESPIGGLQSPAGLYIVWHSGFPAFVIGYAVLKGRDSGKPSSRGTGRDSARAAMILSVALTAFLWRQQRFFVSQASACYPTSCSINSASARCIPMLSGCRTSRSASARSLRSGFGGTRRSISG
jgi:Membrane-associated sensor, integral membrane domain